MTFAADPFTPAEVAGSIRRASKSSKDRFAGIEKRWLETLG